MSVISPVSQNFGSKESLDLVQLTVANTNIDGTGTLVDLKTGGSNGSYVTSVDISAIAASAAGAIRFFLYDTVNNRFLDEVLVPAIPTPSPTVKRFVTVWVPASGLLKIPNGWKLKAATHNAETFNLTIKGGDY